MEWTLYEIDLWQGVVQNPKILPRKPIWCVWHNSREIKTEMTKNPALDDPEVQLIFSYMTGQIARLYQQQNMLMKKLMETKNWLPIPQ